MSQLSTGALAPDFELANVHGVKHRLSEALLRGPVVPAFYKASCPTCQLTFPYLQRIYSEVLKPSGTAFWGISQDDVAETRDFATLYGIEFELLVDEHPYPVSQAYGIEFVPAILIVKEDGTIDLSDFGFTKASLNAVAGFEFMKPDDGLPASRPG